MTISLLPTFRFSMLVSNEDSNNFNSMAEDTIKLDPSEENDLDIWLECSNSYWILKWQSSDLNDCQQIDVFYYYLNLHQ